MTAQHSTGPGLQDLQPADDTRSDFPVYRDLADELAKPGLPLEPGGVVPHLLAVAAAYSYAEDLQTLAAIMTRMGLDRPRCVRVTELVDAMLIDASASVIQSEDGKVVVVAFRGTPPLSGITWLIDTDFRPHKVVLSALQDSEQAQAYQVHAGMYRNLRAIRFALLELLRTALRGESVVPGGPAASPMEALYVTGHSLGGAMAALFNLFLRADPSHADLAATLAGTVTFGQPMVGTRELAARAADGLDERFVRYVYGKDPVPHLPSTWNGEMGHFGAEYRYGKDWELAKHPTGQSSSLLDLAALPVAALLARSAWRRIPLPGFSADDHAPENYVVTLTPPDRSNEYGDDRFSR